MADYKCFALFLSDSDVRGKNYGYRYVKDHINDAVPIPIEIGDKHYDRGCCNIVYEDKVYTPERNFIMLPSCERYYICKPTGLLCDELPEDVPEMTIHDDSM